MAAALLAYVEPFLAPALAPGDVVVLDKLAARKVDGVRQATAAAGASGKASRGRGQGLAGYIHAPDHTAPPADRRRVGDVPPPTLPRAGERPAARRQSWCHRQRAMVVGSRAPRTFDWTSAAGRALLVV